MSTSQSCPSFNPFSTRFTSPISCQFVDPGTDASDNRRMLHECLARFESVGYFGQIIGPHGCGKTTLAVAMAQQLRERFGHSRLTTIRKVARQGLIRFPETVVLTELLSDEISQFDLHGSDKTLILLDGCEILSSTNRRLMVESARRINTSLLVTAHRAIGGLPVISRLRPSLEHFEKIVASLQHEGYIGKLTSQVSDAYQRNAKNYRLGLRQLYDQTQS